MRAFISAGHGGTPGGAIDSGAVVDPFNEHDLCVEIAQVTASHTVDVESILVPSGRLKDKIAWVNRWSRPGDVAVEIHLNAGNPLASGCEAYYASDRGKHLAAELHAALVRCGRSPRGIKPDSQSQHSRLAWCRDTKPWAALVEVAFLTNEEERHWLVHGGTLAAGMAIAAGLDRMP